MSGSSARSFFLKVMNATVNSDIGMVMAVSDLFRKQVIEAQGGAWLGTIRLDQPPRTWVLAVVASGLGCALILLLIFGEYTQRARVQGQLVPVEGLASVIAPATGVMEKVVVTEGDSVKERQILGLIRVPRLTVGHGDVSAAQRKALQQRRAGLEGNQVAQQDRLEVDEVSLRTQLRSLHHELAQLQTERQIRRSQARLANEVLERMRRLQSEKYVSEIQIKQQESAALDRVSASQELDRQASAMQRSAAQIEQALAQIPVERASTAATFRGDLARLSQEEIDIEGSGALSVAAPASGVVSSQIIKPGQAVQVGQPLFTLLPEGSSLQAELLVPSRAIPNLRPGGVVLLRYEAFPHQKFGHHVGHVARISRNALSPADTKALDLPDSGKQPLYRVVVKLDRQTVAAHGRSEPLRPGMTVDADLLGDTRPIFEWLFEPLYALRSEARTNSYRR
ncbi:MULTISPECIES: HlyD family secretion protein [Lysobacter]|uniref:HlyD family secretion protein n=1 Tax=Lysobacter TaxID=68 RepID=UPI001F21B4DB|nr:MULTISPECIES: HlyD family efflux transporter periplasmic adaptor subunit [Lysobacter]UJB19305.1 HlyD family secretion protein [Lysobacter capsici]UJQ26970.1 HlyD family secretion protein [Lysobacter gummosus]